MGMVIDGIWHDDVDRFMADGVFRREESPLPTVISADTVARLCDDPARFVLAASASCPWSHGAVLTAVLAGVRVPVHRAGGPRVEGYALLPDGPLAGDGVKHIHQLYTRSDAAFTGRATVPVLWDTDAGRILSNSSADIMVALNDAGGSAGSGADFYPTAMRAEIDILTTDVFAGLSNAVYRAGLAERQDEYDEAVDTVFATMARLEQRLADRSFLFGDRMTLADIRLFATLVRFDSVYVTHFRCTRMRLTDHPALWRYARRIFQMPGVRGTVDFDEIRFGYYVNDGSHNPHGIIGAQPVIDWDDSTGL